ncbi:MAG: hypothetical protein IKU00_08895 [Bacteroidales bacterium]|nr:hypothetical protein [Bacteroidales bacterium]
MLKPTKREKAGAVEWSDDDWSGGGLIDGEVKRSHRQPAVAEWSCQTMKGWPPETTTLREGRVRGQKRQWNGP